MKLKLLLASLLLTGLCARAQQYSLRSYAIAGGGGASVGGSYAVSGTIGQSAAGSSCGGNYSLFGGFWQPVALQTFAAPTLSIQVTLTNTMLVAWPSSAIGFTLQQSSDLGTMNWSPPSETILNNGTSQFIIVNPSAGKRFYRLINRP